MELVEGREFGCRLQMGRGRRLWIYASGGGLLKGGGGGTSGRKWTQTWVATGGWLGGGRLLLYLNLLEVQSRFLKGRAARGQVGRWGERRRGW